MKNTLKNLTPDQCVHIASLAQPEIQWIFTTPEEGDYEPWLGFDLVEKDASVAERTVFQIDFEKKQFNILIEGHFYVLKDSELEPIWNYLKSIDVILE